MTVEVARDAVKRRDWSSAIEAFGESDEELSPDDLLLLADALWWAARPDEAVETYQRAFESLLHGGRRGEAAAVAATLSYLAIRRLSESVAMGWLSRARGLLADESECPGHAWVALLETAQALFVSGDLDSVIQTGDKAIEVARRQGVTGVEALALSFKGVAVTSQGDWREGMRMIDEATAIATSADGDLRTSSDVYCIMMGTCSSLADYKRASEWTDQAERWMNLNSLGGFTGECQVYRAEFKRLRGDWFQAEHDARVACTELERFHLLTSLGYANYEIGEVRRRMGDLDAAERAFTRAYEYGHWAQPGFSLLMMDRGDLDGAATSIGTALQNTAPAGARGDLLTRGHLLPAQIEIALARNDLSSARAASTQLAEVAATYDSPTWEAMLLTCQGAIALAEGDAQGAVGRLDRAWRRWQAVELPYETARARELLGRARMAAGDETSARLELRAAWATYEKLGARLDLQRIEQSMGEKAWSASSPGQRETKAFMFTDIVTSTDLVGLIGDEAWERLLDWHDRELRASIAAHEGDEVRHTGDGFFVVFESARRALDAAVDIQRRLSEHRLQHGFSPTIRIGIHYTEATRQRGDYAGQGVHVAARIGDIGAGDEIVVSEALLRAAGTVPYQTSQVREVDLKGVNDPVTVMNVDWHT